MFVRHIKDCPKFIAGDSSLLNADFFKMDLTKDKTAELEKVEKDGNLR